MMVEVVQFYERADGCWMELKMDVEAMSAFIERGVNAMLRDAVEQVDDWRDAEQAIKEARCAALPADPHGLLAPLPPMSDLPDFQKLRHNPKHHLGLGDVRITVAQQEAIEQRIAELEAENEHLRKHWTAEKPADLVWNEVDGLHNESDLQRIAELEAQKKDIQDVRDDLRERLDAVAPALRMAFQIAEMERWNDRFPKIFGVMSKALWIWSG